MLVRFSKIQNIGVVTFLGSGSAMHAWGTLISEHRINQLFLNELSLAVKAIEKNLPNLKSVIFTGEGRFFSNGFDLDFFKTQSHSAALQVQIDLEMLMAKILRFPVLTVAALNGHTAAAGVLFSLACDLRVMNASSVFYIPATKLGLTYSPGFLELGKSRLQPQVFRDAFLLSKKYSASEALAGGIVDFVFPGEEAVLSESIRFCELYAFPQSEAKTTMNSKVIEFFENSEPAQRDMGWAKFTSKL